MFRIRDKNERGCRAEKASAVATANTKLSSRHEHSSVAPLVSKEVHQTSLNPEKDEMDNCFPILLSFMQNLSDEQWRTISKELKNPMSKTQCAKLCHTLIKFVVMTTLQVVLPAVGNIAAADTSRSQTQGPDSSTGSEMSLVVSAPGCLPASSASFELDTLDITKKRVVSNSTLKSPQNDAKEHMGMTEESIVSQVYEQLSGHDEMAACRPHLTTGLIKEMVRQLNEALSLSLCGTISGTTSPMTRAKKVASSLQIAEDLVGLTQTFLSQQSELDQRCAASADYESHIAMMTHKVANAFIEMVERYDDVEEETTELLKKISHKVKLLASETDLINATEVTESTTHIKENIPVHQILSSQEFKTKANKVVSKVLLSSGTEDLPASLAQEVQYKSAEVIDTFVNNLETNAVSTLANPKRQSIGEMYFAAAQICQDIQCKVQEFFTQKPKFGQSVDVSKHPTNKKYTEGQEYHLDSTTKGILNQLGNLCKSEIEVGHHAVMYPSEESASVTPSKEPICKEPCKVCSYLDGILNNIIYLSLPHSLPVEAGNIPSNEPAAVEANQLMSPSSLSASVLRKFDSEDFKLTAQQRVSEILLRCAPDNGTSASVAAKLVDTYVTDVKVMAKYLEGQQFESNQKTTSDRDLTHSNQRRSMCASAKRLCHKMQGHIQRLYKNKSFLPASQTESCESFLPLSPCTKEILYELADLSETETPPVGCSSSETSLESFQSVGNVFFSYVKEISEPSSLTTVDEQLSREDFHRNAIDKARLILTRLSSSFPKHTNSKKQGQISVSRTAVTEQENSATLQMVGEMANDLNDILKTSAIVIPCDKSPFPKEMAKQASQILINRPTSKIPDKKICTIAKTLHLNLKTKLQTKPSELKDIDCSSLKHKQAKNMCSAILGSIQDVLCKRQQTEAADSIEEIQSIINESMLDESEKGSLSCESSDSPPSSTSSCSIVKSSRFPRRLEDMLCALSGRTVVRSDVPVVFQTLLKQSVVDMRNSKASLQDARKTISAVVDTIMKEVYSEDVVNMSQSDVTATITTLAALTPTEKGEAHTRELAHKVQCIISESNLTPCVTVKASESITDSILTNLRSNVKQTEEPGSLEIITLFTEESMRHLLPFMFAPFSYPVANPATQSSSTTSSYEGRATLDDTFSVRGDAVSLFSTVMVAQVIDSVKDSESNVLSLCESSRILQELQSKVGLEEMDRPPCPHTSVKKKVIISSAKDPDSYLTGLATTLLLRLMSKMSSRANNSNSGGAKLIKEKLIAEVCAVPGWSGAATNPKHKKINKVYNEVFKSLSNELGTEDSVTMSARDSNFDRVLVQSFMNELGLELQSCSETSYTDSRVQCEASLQPESKHKKKFTKTRNVFKVK